MLFCSEAESPFSTSIFKYLLPVSHSSLSPIKTALTRLWLKMLLLGFRGKYPQTGKHLEFYNGGQGLPGIQSVGGVVLKYPIRIDRSATFIVPSLLKSAQGL